jgi:putative membrane protein
MEKTDYRRFLQTWLINTMAVLVAVYVIPGITFADTSAWTPFVTALMLGILNAVIRPIVMLLALPLLILTLGLFMLVINACMLLLVSVILSPHFRVETFWAALWGAVIISLVSMILGKMTGLNQSRIRIQRHRQPPSPPPPGGKGPVIDV